MNDGQCDPICAALGATPDVRDAVQQAKGATGRLSSLQSPFATQALLGQSPLTTHMPAGLASALSSASDRKKGTCLHWERKHAFQSSLCHPDVVCNCSVAQSLGQTSCLKQFSPEQLVDFHRESFGCTSGALRPGLRWVPPHLACESTGLCGPSESNSRRMVPKTRRADPGRSAHGRSGTTRLFVAPRGSALTGLPRGATGPSTD